MSKNNIASNIKLHSIDSLFGNTDTSKDIDPSKETIIEVPVSELHTFTGHPFRVVDDEKMQETVDSIREHGVLVPGIVRRRAKGGYEIIAGHRRKRACEILGLKTMPVFIRDLSDDEATIVMVDTNIQREEILPSEKAKAYKMKYEALKHQGKSGSGSSFEQMSEETGESRATIQRYVAVADMQPELLKMMDEKKIGFTQAVEFSSLKEEEQKEVAEIIKESSVSPSKSQSSEIKKLSREGNFDKKAVEDIIGNKQNIDKSEIKDIKPNESQNNRKVSFTEKYLAKFFPDDYSEKQIRDVIEKLLEEWKDKK